MNLGSCINLLMNKIAKFKIYKMFEIKRSSIIIINKQDKTTNNKHKKDKDIIIIIQVNHLFFLETLRGINVLFPPISLIEILRRIKLGSVVQMNNRIVYKIQCKMASLCSYLMFYVTSKCGQYPN